MNLKIEIMDTRITELTFRGYGHWRVIVEKANYSRKFPIRLTSITRWEYVTTDSESVDDYRSDDYKRVNRGEKALIRQAKWWGDKSVDKY